MHNVGKIDRFVRIGLALLILVLYFTKVVESEIFLFVAFVLVMTSLRRCCPLYALLGLGTCGTNTGKSDRLIDTDRYKPKQQ
ncbi:MAG: DUF2892 domain-containing protein [Prolixibacteraceae bacterium]|nr:DUF2892 domain-containing protein [Prolixibacteraceae bacterium]